MGMDEAWKGVFDRLAKEDEPHKITFYTKEGYRDLVQVTNTYLDGFDDVKTALDVGCGPGFYVDLLLKHGFKATGVDYSENVINKAKSLFPNGTFEVNNAYDLGFDDDSFDLVLSIGLLQCLYDHEKAIKELCRVSKKYVLLSTLYHPVKRDDIHADLHKKLRYNSWPTRSFHPKELQDLFEEQGYSFEFKTHKSSGERIQDGFFVLATKV